MSRIWLGALCGLIYGALDAALMIPMQFPDKRAAIAGAFINRFSIGFMLGAILLPWPGWATGLFVGVLLSLADAVITKAYVPIISLGALGGLIIGVVVSRFGR
jgi:hypothetical protein